MGTFVYNLFTHAFVVPHLRNFILSKGYCPLLHSSAIIAKI